MYFFASFLLFALLSLELFVFPGFKQVEDLDL